MKSRWLVIMSVHCDADGAFMSSMAIHSRLRKTKVDDRRRERERANRLMSTSNLPSTSVCHDPASQVCCLVLRSKKIEKRNLENKELGVFLCGPVQ